MLAPALVPGSMKAHLSAAVMSVAAVMVADLPEKYRAPAKRAVDVVRRIYRTFR